MRWHGIDATWPLARLAIDGQAGRMRHGKEGSLAAALVCAEPQDEMLVFAGDKERNAKLLERRPPAFGGTSFEQARIRIGGFSPLAAHLDCVAPIGRVTGPHGIDLSGPFHFGCNFCLSRYAPVYMR